MVWNRNEQCAPRLALRAAANPHCVAQSLAVILSPPETVFINLDRLAGIAEFSDKRRRSPPSPVSRTSSSQWRCAVQYVARHLWCVRVICAIYIEERHLQKNQNAAKKPRGVPNAPLGIASTAIDDLRQTYAYFSVVLGLEQQNIPAWHEGLSILARMGRRSLGNCKACVIHESG
jgi:hypothetical protein